MESSLGIHDEILLDAPIEVTDEVALILKKIMEEVECTEPYGVDHVFLEKKSCIFNLKNTGFQSLKYYFYCIYFLVFFK
jgi:hypothetical protein